MKPICVKGRKISSFLIQSDKITYPMEDTKYLEIIPLYKEGYVSMKKLPNGNYKLLRFLYVL